MEEHPNVTIEWIPVANNDLNAQIIALNSSDDLPDAFYMNTAFMSQAMQIGIVIDPTEYLGDEFLSKIDASILDYGSIDGTLLVVPWFMVPIAVIYRADWVEENGIAQNRDRFLPGAAILLIIVGILAARHDLPENYELAASAGLDVAAGLCRLPVGDVLAGSPRRNWFIRLYAFPLMWLQARSVPHYGFRQGMSPCSNLAMILFVVSA